jgi:tRNA(Ile)-lysidine synthase
MESLFNSVKAFFQRYGAHRTYWIAYSGGLDSQVLLQLCAKVRAELSSEQPAESSSALRSKSSSQLHSESSSALRFQSSSQLHSESSSALRSKSSSQLHSESSSALRFQSSSVLPAEFPLQLRAVHINHGLNPCAAKWSEECERCCRDLNIDSQQKSIHVKQALGESPEEAARLGRYTVFAELLAENDFLLTAHHQDDQAETLLLQLFRGAGPKGLAAMPSIKSFAAGFHARPLLDFTRHDLKQYAKEHSLQWIEDESNGNTDFTRNFLRHKVMPLLKTRWPTVTKTLSRVAKHCADASKIIEEAALQDLKENALLRPPPISSVTKLSELEMPPTLSVKKISELGEPATLSVKKLSELGEPLTLSVKKLSELGPPSILSVKKLSELTPMRQRQVLRTWISESKFPLPSALKLKQIQLDFLQAREDKSPHIQWKNVELRRYNHYLYLMKQRSLHHSLDIFHWDLQQPLLLPHIGELHAINNQFEGKQLTVGFRKGGEVCQLPGRKHHHELKKLFQLWNVPPWERNRIPLIYLDNKLIAVVGYFQDEAFFLNKADT